MMKNVFHILGDRVKEVMTLSYTEVEDYELYQGVIEKIEITLYIPVDRKDDAIKAAKKWEAECSGFRYAAFQTDEDGDQTALARGVDASAAARYAAFVTLCDTGVAIDAEKLAKNLKYELNGVVWRVLPYEFEYRSLL